MNNILVELEKKLGSRRVVSDKNISLYITLRTQTVAEYYFEADSREDLIAAVTSAHELNIPFTILGGGSNMAVMEPKIKGLVIRNLYQKLEVIKDSGDTVDLFVSSGYSTGRLVRETVEKGFAGFEYHLGLPGSVGGAIFMNSKWTRPVSYFGDSLVSASIIDRTGFVRKVDREYFQFAYDFSILQKTKEIVLDAVFKLQKMDSALLDQRSKDALAYRKQTQPFGVATSGCFFRNISKTDQESLHLSTTSAGYLIDHAGLKNTEVGGFIVSDKHANFVINKGNGNADDLVKLIGIIKERVKEKFGVELEEEVVVL